MINKYGPFGNTTTSNGGQPLENNNIEFGEDSSFLLPKSCIKPSYPSLNDQDLLDKWQQFQLRIEKFPEDTADVLARIDSDRLNNVMASKTAYEKYGNHPATIVGVGRVSDLTIVGAPCLN